jgi:hypothetical protein
MTIERAPRLIAGVFVVLSVLLGIFVDSRFLWFTLFVGLNPVSVGVHQLVSNDGDTAEGRAATRGLSR